MLRQFFLISTSQFEKSATISPPLDSILTNYAYDILIQIVKHEFLCEKLDDLLHFKKSQFECGCQLGNDLGIPCPYTIRLFRSSQISKKSGELEEEESESTDLLKVTLFHNESFLKLISPEWLVSTFKKAFSPLIQHEPSKFQIIPFESNDDVLSDKNLDILAKNNNLIEDASEEIVFPFFDIKKPKEKKRQNADVIDTHLNRAKITRVNLIALSDHLIETNKLDL